MEDNFLINDDNLQKLYGIAQSKGMPDSYEDLKSYLSASEENRRKFYDKLSSMGMPDSYEQYSAYIGQSAPAPQRTDVSDVEQAGATAQPVEEVASQPSTRPFQPMDYSPRPVETAGNMSVQQEETTSQPVDTMAQQAPDTAYMPKDTVQMPQDTVTGQTETQQEAEKPRTAADIVKDFVERNHLAEARDRIYGSGKAPITVRNGKTSYNFSPENVQAMRDYQEQAYEAAMGEVESLMPEIERSVREKALFDTEQNNRNKDAKPEDLQWHADRLAEQRLALIKEKLEEGGVGKNGLDFSQDSTLNMLSFDDNGLREKLAAAYRDKSDVDNYMDAYYRTPEGKAERVETVNNVEASLQGIKERRSSGFWKTVGAMFADMAISGAMAEGGMDYRSQEQLREVQDNIRKTASVNMAVNQQLHDAENTLAIAKKNIEEGEGNAFVKFGRGVRYSNLDNLIPVSELYGQMGILQLYDKLDANGNPKEQLSEEEQNLYEALAMNQYVQQVFGGDVNMLNRIGRGLPEQAAFTLQFLLSSEFAGAQTIGEGATKALRRGISRGINREIKSGVGRFMLDKALPTAVGMGAETIYRTGLQLPSIMAGGIERHVGTLRIDPETGEVGGFEGGVDWGEALWKSTLSVANENFTELLGDQAFQPGWEWLARNTKAGKAVAAFREGLGQLGDGTVGEWLEAGANIRQKAGWAGWSFETLEEMAGSFNDAAFIHDQTWEQAFSKESVMETVLNCMIFGVVMGSTTNAAGSARNLPSAVETRNEKRKAAAIIDRMDGISTAEIDGRIDTSSSNELADWLVRMNRNGNHNGDWTDEQRAAVANYVKASVEQRAQRHFKGMRLQEDVKAMEATADDMVNNQSGDIINANFTIDGQQMTGTIVGGRVSAVEDNATDAEGNPKKAFIYNPNLSSVTLTVRLEDGTKKQIPARDVTSINDIVDAEQFKAERASELQSEMQRSVADMYKVTTASDIWSKVLGGKTLQAGMMLPYNGGIVRLDGKNADGQWLLTPFDEAGKPGMQFAMDDFEFRKIGMVEGLRMLQQQQAPQEEIDDAVDDIDTEDTLHNIEQSDDEDNIWDNIAGFMQGYVKTNEEGDFVVDESRPDAAAGYLVALQKGDIAKTIDIVNERIAELQTRLGEKTQGVQNNGEGVVGMAANQSLADSAADDIQKQIDFLSAIRDGLVAKQQEKAEMDAMKPVSQMEEGTEFEIDWNGEPAIAVVGKKNESGNREVTVYDMERNILQSVDDMSDEEWEALRVKQQDSEQEPQPEPEPTPVQPTPTPQGPAPAAPAAAQPVSQNETPEQTQIPTTSDVGSSMELPRDKEGNIDYEQITDPALYAQGLVEEFGDEAVDTINELINEETEALAKAGLKKNAIERRRAQKESQGKLDFYNKVKDIIAPQEQNETATEETTPVEEVPTEQPVAESQEEASAEEAPQEGTPAETPMESAGEGTEQTEEQTENNINDEQAGTDTEAVASQAEAVASQAESDAENITTEQQGNEIAAAIDEQLDKVNEQLALLGYYKADTEDGSQFNESYGFSKTAEKKAVKDMEKLARKVAKDLGIEVGRKKLAYANIAPAGGEVYFKLPLSEGKELHLWIGLYHPGVNSGGYYNDDLEMDWGVFRIEQPAKSGIEKYGNNNNFESDITYDRLISDIKYKVRRVAPEFEIKETEGQTDTQPVSQVINKKPKKKSEKSNKTDEAALPTQQTEQPAEATPTEIAYGANNKLVSTDQYEELKRRMKEKLRGQANAGFDPEILSIGAQMAVYHIEAGARKFADFAKRMIDDLGDAIRPYLKGIYNGARDILEEQAKELVDGMTPYDEVRAFDVSGLGKEGGSTLVEAAQEAALEGEIEKQQREATEKIKEIAQKGKKDKTDTTDTTDNGVHQYTEQQKKAFSEAVTVDMRLALERGEKPYRSINDIRKRAESVGMEVDKEGRDDILLQELVEDGLVRAARQVIESGRFGGAKSREAFDAICKLYEMQPTISMRSSNRVKMQQYSTTLPMAFVADMFAYKGGKVLEPTAGNGMLVFAIPSKNVTVNELDETRLANLREQGFPMVLNEDALTVPFVGKYDSVIANPPFGKADARDYDGKMIAGLDEQITLNALSAMKDDGRAAIIIGGNMEYGKNGGVAGNRAFWTYLYDHYNVKGVVDMEGKLYGRQGTTYPTRMILIDGRRSEEERAQTAVYPPVKEKAVRKAESFDDLYDIVTELLSLPNKTNGNEVLRDKPPVSDNNGTQGQTGVQRRGEESDENDSDVGGRDGRGNGVEGTRPNAQGEVRPTKGDSGSVDAGQRPSGLSGTQSPQNRTEREPVVPDSGTAERPGRGANDRGSTESEPNGEPGRVSNGGLQDVSAPVQRVGLTQPKEQEKRTLTEEKLPYRQHNSAFSLESVAPAAMVEAMDKALTEIEKTYGKSIDEFVTEELGYESVEDMHNALAAEQVDSVAMAIHQMKQGQAMIIGDQTGVGKGRQMAALIRWAHRQGKKPIFITKDANLFSDIYRDLVDVGSGDLKPFIFNKYVGKGKGKDTSGEMVDADGNLVHKGATDGLWKKVLEEGKLPDEYDFAVLTYSQVNTGDQQSREEARKEAKENGTRRGSKKKDDAAKISPKAPFLRALAKDNYLLLDESHTAAGESNIGAFLQSILREAKAVTFASATFAKRPDTMPLYAIRTAMSKANVKANELINIIKKGGVTLQEIMSRALTEAGQMVRRERNMNGVKTDWETISDPKLVKSSRESYDRTIAAFNAIIKFQEDYIKPMIAALSGQLAFTAGSADVKRGTEKAGVDNTPFASKTYNYTKQLMLALKVDAVVDKVVSEIEAGRHPVIALESTMESFLDDYAIGDVINEPTLSLSLLKGLDSVMQYTIKDENGEESHQRYTPEDLGEEGERAYYELQDFIRESTKGIFISPLDAIISKLNEKGYKVGELTGRSNYLEYNDKGQAVVKSREDKDKKRMMREFNSGALDVLILNKSASTGISLHASKKFSDQRQRTMVIAQPLSDINDYMQMIGRIDRTGQVHRGYYINLGLPVPAENRFLMMLSTKLKSLNANTTTSQESESNSVEAPDLLNKYGSRVVVEYLRDNSEIYVKIGEPLKTANGTVKANDLDDYQVPENDDVVRKITGRVALLTTKEQEEFYNDVVRRYTDLIKYLDDTGTNDLKITVMPLKAKTLEKKVSSEGVDPNGSNPFAKDAYVETVEMDVLRKPMKADDVRKTIEQLNTTKGDEAESRVKEIIGTVQREAKAKLEAEEQRYEEAKKKAVEDIEKQRAKINKQQKRTEDEKAEAIEKFITDTNTKVEEQHQRNVMKIEALSELLEDKLTWFKVGGSYLMPDVLESESLASPELASPAIFCGYKAKDSKITSSTTFAVFATLDGRRRIEVKLSDNAAAAIGRLTSDNYDIAQEVTLDNWDSKIPTNTRKTGYIMTGNILQAVKDTQDPNGNYPGQLVSYTDEEGNVHDGILMPDKWQPGMMKNSGKPINAVMSKILNGELVKSTDGKVSIYGSGWAKTYTLTVPKTKKDGGVYFENPVILKSVSSRGFWQNRGEFRADINGEDNMRAVVNELAKLGVRVSDEQQGDGEVMYRIREEEAPKKTKKVYKLMRLDDGKLYPLFIDRNAEAIELGVWYNADSPNVSDLENLEAGYAYKIDRDGNVVDTKKINRTEKGNITGLPNVKSVNDAAEEGSRWITVTLDAKENRSYHNVGINGAEGTTAYAMRPGWHAGSLPSMRQIGKGKNRNIRDQKFVWVEGEVAADVDYQSEAEQNPTKDIPTHIPTNGYYMKATNADKVKSQADRIGWYISGAFKPNRVLSDAEARDVIDKYNTEHPDAPVDYDYERENGEFTKEAAERVNNSHINTVEEAREAANDTINKLGLQDRVTILDSTEGLEGKNKTANGWFDPKTGKIVIVMPNHSSPRDVVKTILHEGVAHYGLRKLVGEKNMNDFLDRVFEAADKEVRERIIDLAMRKYDRNFRKATEEYLAGLAEDTNFDNPTFLEKVKALLVRLLDKMGIQLGDGLTDNELRYILWKSYRNLVADAESLTEVARDVAMQSDLQVGNFEAAMAAESMAREDVTYRTDMADISGVISDKGEINNEKLNEIIKSVQEGRAKVSRIPSGIGEAHETVPAIAAQAIAQGYFDSEFAGNGSGEGEFPRVFKRGTRQALKREVSKVGNLIKQWAKDNGYWYDEAQLKEQGPEIMGGAESRVFVSENGNTVVKSTAPYIHNGYVQLVIESMEMFGRVFQNTPYTIVGFAEENGHLCVVATQPYVQGMSLGEYAKQQGWVDEDGQVDYDKMMGYVDKAMREQFGLERKSGYGNYTDGTYNVTDAHRKNVIVDAEGNLSVIDASVYLNDDDYDNDDILFRDAPTSNDRAIAQQHYESVISSGWFQAREALQDSMLGLKVLYESIEGKKLRMDRDLHDFENAYQYENRMGSMNQAQSQLYYYQYMKPLINAVHDLGGDTESGRQAVNDYMMAKHGLERNHVLAIRDAKEAADNGADYDEELKKNRKKDYSGLTALTGKDSVDDAEAAAKQIVDDFESAHDKAKVDALWSATNAATDEILATVLDSGVKDRASIERMRKMFKYYIPLRGWSETTSDQVYAYLDDVDGMFNGSVIKHAKGRSSKADDPIAYISMMADDAIRQGNRNLMKIRFLNYVRNHPSDLVSVSDLWLKKNGVTGEWEVVEYPELTDANGDHLSAAEVKRKMDDFENRMKQLAAAHPKDYKHGKDAVNIPYKVVKGNLKEHQVLVKQAGKTYVLTINGNPRAAHALNGETNPNKRGEGVMNLMQAALEGNRKMAKLFTTLNPEFVASNFARDTVYTILQVGVKDPGKYAWQYRKNHARYNPAVMMSLFKKWHDQTLDMNDKTDKMFYDFMVNGGETGYTNIQDIEKRKKKLARELEKKGFNTAADGAEYVMDFLNRSVENTARFAAFVTSREAGRSIGRSISDAKEISVNFNKKGAGDTYLKSRGQTFIGNTAAIIAGFGRTGYIFWNAGIQGVVNVARGFKYNPVRATLMATAVMGLGAAVALLAGGAFGGDGDDDYWDLPEYERRSNIIIRVSKGKFIKIPLPVEYRALYGMGELLVGAMSGKEEYSNSELAFQLASQVSQVLPLDMLEGGGGLAPLVPTVLKPLNEVRENKSWTGRPIYKHTDFNNLDPEYKRVYSNTGKGFVDFSKWINEITGGDEYTKSWLDKIEVARDVNVTNPAVQEHLVRGYLGGAYGTIAKMFRMGETIFGEREFAMRDVPIASRFFTIDDDRTKGSSLTGKYYDLKNEYEATQHSLKGYEIEIEKAAAEHDMIEYAKWTERKQKLLDSPAGKHYETFRNYDNKTNYGPGIHNIMRQLKKEDDPNTIEELEALRDMWIGDLLNEIKGIDNNLRKKE